MGTYAFAAIGTTWSITTDGNDLSVDEKNHIREYIADFEKRFSRFLPDSEVNAFRYAQEGTYEVSETFSELLHGDDRVRVLTNGSFDPAVTALLEQAGYDTEYSFLPDARGIESFTMPTWSIHERTLTIDGPVVFDFGGTGKGYCIDRVAHILESFGYANYIVEAGGDMYGTTKNDGTPWRVAIEYPGKPEVAAGVIELDHRALAVSDSFRRAWNGWHHIVDPKDKKPVERVVGAAAVAKNAWCADAMTSVLFLGSEDNYATVAQQFSAAYLVFLQNGSLLKSKNWEGTLFT